MRKLTVLFLAIGLALYAYSTIHNAENVTSNALVNGLLAALFAAVCFAIAAGSLPPMASSGVAREWPLGGRVLVGVALLAAVGATVVGEGAWEVVGWAGALVLLAAGVWWPGEPEGYQSPAYRWTTDAAGHWVRAALGDGEAAENELAYDRVQDRGLYGYAVLVVVTAAAAMRVWRLAELPPGCVAAECDVALQLVNGTASVGSLVDLLAQGLYRFTGDGLYSLRLAATVIGIVTLAVFYWAARPLDRAGGVGLATVLLAFSPWHVWAARTSEPWIAAPLLILMVVGATMRAYASVDRRWWWAAGLATGLLIASAGPMQSAALIWVLTIAALGIVTLESSSVTTRTLAYDLAAMLASAVVVVLIGRALWAGAAPPLVPEVGLAASASSIVFGLLHSGGAVFGYFLEKPLLSALPASLAMIGIGLLLRSIRRPYAALISAGLVVFGLAQLRTTSALTPLAGSGLTLLSFVFLAAAVTLDTLLYTFYLTWRSLVSARRMLMVALVVVTAAAGWQAFGFVRGLDEVKTTVRRSVDEAIGRHAARCLSEETYSACVTGIEIEGDSVRYTPVIYAPAAALEHPSTRLLMPADSDPDRLRVLDMGRDLPPSPIPEDPVLYLVPIEEQASVNLVREFYPSAEVHALPLNDGPTKFVAVAVNRDALLARQGLQGLYFTGTEFGSAETASMSSRDGPLQFAWGDEAPLPGPFSVVWEGSLRAPVSGDYRFTVDPQVLAADSRGAFTLQLDDRLIVDTSLGLMDREEKLAEGFYRISMRYWTDGAAQDWAVRWQPPGGEFDVVPREALYSPTLPDVGLIGTYIAGDSFDGPALTSRKDRILTAEADLPRPYSVMWQGKLAAPRAGEYLFAATSNGELRIKLNGLDILARDRAVEAGIEEDGAPVYSQSSVYLPVGWHDVEILYAPAEQQPSLRLLWQPPGSSPSLIESRYLRPELGQIFPGDVRMPEAPVLLDPRLGDDRFALSFGSEIIEPQTVLPPSNLPQLLVERVWQVGGQCGSGEDQLNGPHGVAIDEANGRVYVADTLNQRVTAYDVLSGDLIADIEHATFEEPVDLAMLPDGTLLVLDAVAHPLFRVDPVTGNAEPMDIDTTFYRPRGMSVDGQGNVYVADTGGARVVMLDAQGRQLMEDGGPGTMLGVGQPVDTLATNGATWAVTAEDGRLWRLDDLAAITIMLRGNTIDGPHMAALPDGSFFVTNPVDGVVLYLTAQGQPVQQLVSPGAFVAPVGVAAAEVERMLYLAVSDPVLCSVSVWRGPLVQNAQ